MEIIDLYVEGEGNNELLIDKAIKAKVQLKKINKTRRLIFRNDLDLHNFYEGTQWWVLKKVSGNYEKDKNLHSIWKLSNYWRSSYLYE